MQYITEREYHAIFNAIKWDWKATEDQEGREPNP